MHFLTVHTSSSAFKLHTGIMALVKNLDYVLMDEESLQQILVQLQEELNLLALQLRVRKPQTLEIIRKPNLILINLIGTISIHAHWVLNTVICDALHPAVPTDFLHPKTE